MERSFPGTKLERYADDIVIHCESKEQSESIEQALAARLKECGLTLHPEKTRVVYCKDGKRKGLYATKKFTFLGYTFQPRSSKNQRTGEIFTGFLPAASREAEKKFRSSIKQSGILKLRSWTLENLAKQLNPRIRGWYQYFSHFYQSALKGMNDWLDRAIAGWLKCKYALNPTSAWILLKRIAKSNQTLFEHWRFGLPGRAV